MDNDIDPVGFRERITYAFKAFWHVLLNRPIICYFDDSIIYARTNPYYMKAAADKLSAVADMQITEEIMDSVRNLVEIPKHRQN
jgi:hypothetical protein